MHVNQPHYLPLPLPFFSILVGVFVFLVVLLQVRALRFAYMSIGFSAGGAMLVLLGSLVGSYFNIPVALLPADGTPTTRRRNGKRQETVGNSFKGCGPGC